MPDRDNGRYSIAGRFSVNSNDRALMVRKRYGVGWTLNFGHPICWFTLALLLLMPPLINII